MLKEKMMKKILMILMVLTLGWISQGQTVLTTNPLEKFIYVKMVGGTKSFVVINGDNYDEYTLQSGECGDISDDGRYLALSSEQADILRIIHLASKKVIFTTDWEPEWYKCVVVWGENNLLTMGGIDFVDRNYTFDGESLTPITITSQTPTYPSLPDFYPIEGIPTLLQNPVYPHIYLYKQCLGYQRYNIENCLGGGFIIYDTLDNQQLENLQNGSSNYMIGFDIDLNYNYIQYLSVPLVSWSPDGRYIAYFSRIFNRPIPHEGKIIIYDMLEDRYLDDSPALYLPNIGYPLQWAGDNTLIFRAGHVGEISGYDFHSRATIFNFFNAETETYVTGDKIFDVVSELVLTPDRNSIMFTGKEIIQEQTIPQFDEHRSGNLIMMSTLTGESTVIDTDVTEIITWRSVCDFTASDTASLISTMQTELYSVICLDENGQYDITAPLPDVAGDITIIGNGATLTMTGQNRILNVVYNQQWSRNGSLTLKNVTLSGGVADEGGAIYNAGDLMLDDVTLQNHSAVRGGAIYNAGNLVMNGGAIQNNSASEFGGGIYTIGDMQLDGVNIADNTAPEGSGVYQGE